MEIVIMKKSYDEKDYQEIFSDNIQMNVLGEFFEMGISHILHWKDDLESIGPEDQIATDLDHENNIIRIYSDWFFYSEEDAKYYYKNAFISPLDIFMQAIEKWKEILEKKPQFVIIKKIGNNIIFEEDYRDNIELDFFKTKLTEYAWKYIITPKIKDGLFYGGYHLKDDSKELEMSDKLTADKNIMSFDIKFAKDFTFNHAFFPPNWDKKRLKKEIIQSLKKKKIKVLPFFIKISNKRGIFFIIRELITGLISIKIIFNQNLEVVTCYPLFRKR